jgi:signal transduction histidine kinase
MSLRQKLLLLFSLTVAASVAAVTWTVLVRIRVVFEQRDHEETVLFVSQFQREFQHRSSEVATAVDRIAARERMRTMAYEIAQSNDASPYLNEATALTQDAQLDFLEIVGADGNIISSAQWPARFGYPEPTAQTSPSAFLKREDLPDGTSALGLFSVIAVKGSEAPLKLIGGKRLDQSFLADLPVAPGMMVSLYSDTSTNQNADTSQTTQLSANTLTPFDSKRLVGINGDVPAAAKYQPLIDAARASGQQNSAILYLTDRREESVSATAIPLKNAAGSVMAVLTVSISRAGMVEAQQHIRNIAYGVAAAGILFAILCSLWIAARVSRPIEQLARAAEEVAGGNWEARVPVRGRDEVGVLGRSFNHMTAELVSQRERLVQTERVAAWRELARRLAHELKNPLFPLQLTVENLTRARALPPDEFDEIFQESTATLSMEIANLKTIIGRFSDFSKMPRPQLERIDADDALARVMLLYFPSIIRTDTSEQDESTDEAKAGSKVNCTLIGASEELWINADPELLHRALSNLVLNAIDAMPDGGTLTLSAKSIGEKVEIRVADTGEGMAPEECERLFTPYYTTKEHGTGLGLAIVQSVIADHGGTITVESKPGEGTTFVITLPMAN